MHFTIKGELADINQIVKKSKQHYGSYATLKKNNTALVALSARNLPKIKSADFVITWYSKNRRKDPDNIAGGGTKMLLDGLVKAGKLENDGWKQIKSITHHFKIDKQNPRIEVQIYERNNQI